MTIGVIGLISGTSVDGIDAALVQIDGKDVDLKVELKSAATYSYPETLRKQILDVCAGAALSMAELAELDDAIAQEFARAALTISNGSTVALIGSHGQTVYHRPPQEQGETLSRGGFKEHIVGNINIVSQSAPINQNVLRTAALTKLTKMGYSLQLGRGGLIADLTGITTVSNFRANDIATGGQGAPLVSKVDLALLGHPTKYRCVQNIGGIGNVTYLPPHGNIEGVTGWDTGPGNSLIDLAVQHLTNGSKTYDADGAWAATGNPYNALVEQWLQQDFFQIPPPKSTGRELFGLDYLQQCLADAEAYQLDSANFLATLTELTAASIAHSYRSFLPKMPDEVLVCGGGSRNLYLKQRLQAQMEGIPVLTTDESGLSADFKEAIAFAILAYWRYTGIAGNLPQVTGARKAVLLGDIHESIT